MCSVCCDTIKRKTAEKMNIIESTISLFSSYNFWIIIFDSIIIMFYLKIRGERKKLREELEELKDELASEKMNAIDLFNIVDFIDKNSVLRDFHGFEIEKNNANYAALPLTEASCLSILKKLRYAAEKEGPYFAGIKTAVLECFPEFMEAEYPPADCFARKKLINVVNVVKLKNQKTGEKFTALPGELLKLLRDESLVLRLATNGLIAKSLRIIASSGIK